MANRPYRLQGYKLLRALRNAAYRAQSGLCHWCSEPMLQGAANKSHPRYATAEHLIPKYAGGKTVHGNIVAACAKCNNERNVETNHSKQQPLPVLTIGDDTPHSPFEALGALLYGNAAE